MNRWRAVLRGAASLLDFQGALIPQPLPDQEALAQAWNEVGTLISDAFNQLGPPPGWTSSETTDPRRNHR